MPAPRGYFETCGLGLYLTAAAALALLMCWPIWVMGQPFFFFDSDAYLLGGGKIWAYAASVLQDLWPAGTEAAGTASEAPPPSARVIRSITYSLFLFATVHLTGGFATAAFMQSFVVSLVLLLLVPARPAWTAVLALLAVLLFATPLPFYSAYLMPDILTACIPLAALVLIRGTTRRGYVVVTLAGAIALASHYGNPPVAVLVFAPVVLVLLVRRALIRAAVLAMVLPFAAAFGLNALASTIAFDSPSVAPKRLPVLLARSLEDGPARWHLEAQCDTYNYTICRVVDEIPDNVGAALWKEDGMMKRATREEVQQIRAEEMLILRRTLAEYPLQQIWSLSRNAALQVVRFGLSDVYQAEVIRGADGSYDIDLAVEARPPILDRLEILHAVVVGLAMLWLLMRLPEMSTSERRQFAILILALLANAAVFGGLSAPVDRYQGRLIWLVVALAGVIWLARGSALGPPRQEARIG